MCARHGSARIELKRCSLLHSADGKCSSSPTARRRAHVQSAERLRIPAQMSAGRSKSRIIDSSSSWRSRFHSIACSSRAPPHSQSDRWNRARDPRAHSHLILVPDVSAASISI